MFLTTMSLGLQSHVCRGSEDGTTRAALPALAASAVVRAETGQCESPVSNSLKGVSLVGTGATPLSDTAVPQCRAQPDKQ